MTTLMKLSRLKRTRKLERRKEGGGAPTLSKILIFWLKWPDDTLNSIKLLGGTYHKIPNQLQIRANYLLQALIFDGERVENSKYSRYVPVYYW